MSKNRILLLIFFFFLIFTIGLLVYYLGVRLKTKQPISTPSDQVSTKPTSSCVIFDEEFCRRGEKVYYNDKFYGLGFKLPEGAKIYAPFEGPFSDTPRFLINNVTYRGVDVYYQPMDVLDENTLGFSVIVFPKSVSEKIRVETGEFIAEVGGGTIESLGDYNVIIQLLKFNPITKFMENDPDLFKRFFAINL